jgi:hypothetical protein
MDRPRVSDLLERADAARSAGEGSAAARLYDEAIELGRADGDLEVWTRAALGAASVHLFGTEPGRLPAQLYDVLVRTTASADRARVSAALARCWAYSGHPDRGARFAEEALEHAERVGDPELLADCLDAALTAHWGPDDLDERAALTARLGEVAAHVLDPGARLQATMWNLEVACQLLDVPGMHRQMRVLERLGEESPRAQFFAASRRLMLDLLRGRVDTAPGLVEIAETAGREAGLADSWMVVEAMKGYAGLQSGDAAACAVVAAECEGFGEAEGSVAVSAEAAYLWAGAGRTDRAAKILDGLRGEVLDRLPRDVNWLLTMQCALFAALDADHDEVIETAARLLTPYEGRAVFNTGALMFHGVTDDPLARASARRGDQAATRLRAQAIGTYTRLGATWWRDRLAAAVPEAPPALAGATVRLHPTAGGWLVGSDSATVPLRPLRGFDYLAVLLGRPGQEVPALDLATGGNGAARQGDLGELVDRQALGAYRQRLSEIDQELAEADAWADAGRLDVLRDEREALLAEVGSATGLGGRIRTTGSDAERARVAVTKAITTAIDRISEADPAVGAHLRSRVHTGGRCAYLPLDTDRVRWVLRAQ